MFKSVQQLLLTTAENVEMSLPLAAKKKTAAPGGSTGASSLNSLVVPLHDIGENAGKPSSQITCEIHYALFSVGYHLMTMPSWKL